MSDGKISLSDLRRLSILACMFLVLLRISIGWQLLYEGLWKVNSTSTATPWSAEGYLKNARGPFRDYFRSLSGDPDELNWLDSEKVSRQWDVWFSYFVPHYQLDKKQQEQLLAKLTGPKQFSVRLERLPDGVNLSGPTLSKAVQYDEDRKLLKVPADWHLKSNERDALLKMATPEDHPPEVDKKKNEIAREFQSAVRELYKRQSRLSFKERLKANLDGDASRAGVIDPRYSGTIDYKRKGEIERYKEELKRYEQNLAKARQAFNYDHLQNQWQKIQQARAKLVGPVKALDQELKDTAQKLLTEAQLARGPVRLPLTPVDQINLQTMWGLTIIGSLLILGLFSRLSALAGAGLLTMFYLAYPPWPGVADFIERPGPEHSYIIDKNMIEVIVLLAMACMPTGRWFGLDAVVRRFILRKTTD